MSGRVTPSRWLSNVSDRQGLREQADQSIHLAYEVVNLSSQAARVLGVEETEEKKAVAMSGRMGTGVKARDFIEMVKQKVIEKADHPLEPEVASVLASAAIRYYLLKFTLESQIIFDFDEALKTTGDTGVYLEYAHARACSILRKAEERGIDLHWKKESVPTQLTETEKKSARCPVGISLDGGKDRSEPEGFPIGRVCLSPGHFLYRLLRTS